MESIDFDPSRQDAIIARLDQIYSLQQKYRVSTVAELLQLQASIQQQLESIENADGDLALLRQEVAEQEKLCREKAQQLTLSRTASARQVEAEMHARLVPLGIPNVRFEVEVKPLSYVIAAVATMAFALLVQLFVNPVLDRIDPISSLKSVE